MLDGHGLHNGCKLGGILSRPLLMPHLHRAAWIPFFMMPTHADPGTRGKALAAAGGKLISGPLEADGQMVLVEDQAGAVLGLYHRTDDWDDIKPETKLTST